MRLIRFKTWICVFFFGDFLSEEVKQVSDIRGQHFHQLGRVLFDDISDHQRTCRECHRFGEFLFGKRKDIYDSYHLFKFQKLHVQAF